MAAIVKKVIITVHTDAGSFFQPSNFIGTFGISGNLGSIIVNFQLTGLHAANNAVSPTIFSSALLIGPHTMSLTIAQIQPPGPNVTDTNNPLTADFDFYDGSNNLLSSLTGVSMTYNNVSAIFSTQAVQVNITCLHGDSIVQSSVGPQKIKDTKTNDLILTGENKFAKVLDLAQCRIKITDAPSPHDAIIFEPNSLDKGEPNERLIIDPGHPMATKAEFEKHGVSALKRAGEYLGTAPVNLIYQRKWDDPIIQTNPEKQSIRYDLVLEGPHQTYIANGVVVKARESVENPGYDHRYDNFV